MPTREELLSAAHQLERDALSQETDDGAARLQRVARWLREQAELVPDVSVG